ncbi:MAG: cation transporter [Planctomycetota bacterium]
MRTLNLTLEGMTCAHCVMRVQRVLARFDGLRVEALAVGTARVATERPPSEDAALLAALAAAGYPAKLTVEAS